MRHQHHLGNRGRHRHQQNEGHVMRQEQGMRRNYTAHNPEGHNQYSHSEGQDHSRHRGSHSMQGPSEHSVREHMRQNHWNSSTHPRDDAGRFTSSHQNPPYGRQQMGSNYDESYDRYESPSRNGRGAQSNWQDDEGRFQTRNNRNDNDYDRMNDRRMQRDDYAHYETRGRYDVDQYGASQYDEDNLSDIGISANNREHDDYDDMDPEELDNRLYYGRSDFSDRDRQSDESRNLSHRGYRGHHRR